MFKKQITKPDVARKNAQQWPEMYKSAAYKEVTDLIRPVCASFLQNGGMALSVFEEERFEVVAWFAVYPGAARPDDPITHFFHAHQESVVSGVLFLQARFAHLL